MNIARVAPTESLDFSIGAETDEDIAAREALLDRAMGPGRKRKSSEKLRRGRRPSEGLAFIARDASGTVVGTVRLWDVTFGAGSSGLVTGPWLKAEGSAQPTGPSDRKSTRLNSSH